MLPKHSLGGSNFFDLLLRSGQQFVGQWLDSKPQWIQPLVPELCADGDGDGGQQAPPPPFSPSVAARAAAAMIKAGNGVNGGLSPDNGTEPLSSLPAPGEEGAPEGIQRLASEARAKAQAVSERDE